MADTRHQDAVKADNVLSQILAGTYPAGAPRVDATGERWEIVADRMAYDATGGFYREHGRGHVNSGRRV